MENQLKHARHLGTSDLQAIGKQAYEQALAGVETAARLDPDGVETVLRPTWSAFHYLLQLLIANGGAPVQVDGLKDYLRRELGFNDARLGNLCNVASLTANGDGILNEHRIDPLIKGSGLRRDRPKQASGAAG